MNKAEITQVLKELNTATGFRISLHDSDAEEISAYPSEIRGFCACIQENPEERALCEKCDNIACKKAIELGGTYSYKCRYGLTEIVSPIYNYDRLVGFLMMGQTAESEDAKNSAAEKLAELGISPKAREVLISEIPTVNRELAASFSKILTICAKYLTLSGAVYGKVESLPEAAMRFINNNYSKKIHIKDICAKLNCSKSTLLSGFKDEYGITVNTAICRARLTEAKRQLAQSKDSNINDIALANGFSDQSYFSKVFSAEYGESPSEYKRRICSERDGGESSLL